MHLQASAISDLDRLRKFDAVQVADAMEKHLTETPGKVGKSRIKRLRGITNPDYRLRVGDFRVFYNIDEPAGKVVVLRVLNKDLDSHKFSA